MDHKTVEDYVLSMPNSRLDYPFGKDVAVYKVFVPDKTSTSNFNTVQGVSEERIESYESTVKEVPEQDNEAVHEKHRQSSVSDGTQNDAVRGDWKMYALIHEGSDPVRISLKCDPQLGKLLREKYVTVMEGYHLNKKHWITIVLSGEIEWEEIKGFIRHSYDLVIGAKHAYPE